MKSNNIVLRLTSLLFIFISLVGKCVAQKFGKLFTPAIIIGSQVVILCCIVLVVCICLCIVKRKRRRRASTRQKTHSVQQQKQSSTQSHRQLSENQPALGNQPCQSHHSYGANNSTQSLSLPGSKDNCSSTTTTSQTATTHCSEPAVSTSEGVLHDAPPAYEEAVRKKTVTVKD